MVRRMIAMIAALGLSVPPAAAQDVQLDDFFKLIQTGEVSAVALALEHQPELATARDRFEFSAVHVLDYNGFSEKLALLQKFGADVNAQNDGGIGLMHIIVDPEFIPQAVAAGGDINLRDAEGRTPIMVYMFDYGPDDPFNVVLAALTAGADPNAFDKGGKSVLEYADALNDPELTAMLVQGGAVR